MQHQGGQNFGGQRSNFSTAPRSLGSPALGGQSVQRFGGTPHMGGQSAIGQAIRQGNAGVRSGGVSSSIGQRNNFSASPRGNIATGSALHGTTGRQVNSATSHALTHNNNLSNHALRGATSAANTSSFAHRHGGATGTGGNHVHGNVHATHINNGVVRGGVSGHHGIGGYSGRNFVAHSGHYYPRNSFFFGVRSPFGFYSNPWYYRSYYRPFYGLGFGLYGGYWPWYGYNPIYSYGYGPYGYSGYGYGDYGYGYAYNPTFVTVYNPVADGPVIDPALVGDQLPPDQLPPDAAAPEEINPQDANVLDFATQGEADFKAGRYDDAIKNWQHALVDEPRNGALVLLMAQALFATGKFNEAAGAVQGALSVLPQDKWGVVVENYAELYGDPADYTQQLRALEAARKKDTDQPALRFLLGYHYAYLGYPREAVRELNKGLELAPKDEVAKKLLDATTGRLNPAAAGPAEALPNP